MNRAAHSFFAAFVGWLVPFVGYLAWLQFDDGGFGFITDFEFLLFWPLLFTALGWLLVGLPLVLLLGRGAAPGFERVIIIATAATTATFLTIATLLPLGLMTFVWWPVLIGLIGGSVYWLLQKLKPPRAWAFWIAPILFFPFVRFVALPIGVACFPYTTYVLADGIIGNEVRIRVIKRVDVGDTYDELHRRYPLIFRQPVLGSSFSGGGWTYSIRFDDSRQRVVQVLITRDTNSEQGAAPGP